MIEHHEKFEIPDAAEKNPWYMEVNWNKLDRHNVSFDKLTNECKVIKVTHPGGKVSMVKKEHLNAVLFAIGKADEQREMIPQKVTKVRKFSKMLTVKALKAMEKGEEMIFPYSFEIPVDQYETVGNLKAVKKDKHHVIGTGTKLPT